MVFAKITIIMVTHDINEATSISDRILILKKPIQNKISDNRLIKINKPDQIQIKINIIS